jgi:hypothetical protein
MGNDSTNQVRTSPPVKDVAKNLKPVELARRQRDRMWSAAIRHASSIAPAIQCKTGTLRIGQRFLSKYASGAPE